MYDDIQQRDRTEEQETVDIHRVICARYIGERLLVLIAMRDGPYILG